MAGRMEKFAQGGRFKFMPYVCCGDPDDAFTEKLVKAI